MLRTAAMLLLLGRVAFAEDAPVATTPVSEARQALLERAAAPTAAARLPVLGIDPLRRASNALKQPGPSGGVTLPGQRGPRGMVQSGPDRARGPAERAADRAMGDGDRGGPPGRGPPGRRGGDHDKDHDHDHDGPPPPPGSGPPHPP